MNFEMLSTPRARANRLARERRTIAVMLRIYCRAQHGGGRELCEACTQLHTYAFSRLDHCPYGGDKPACADCPIHCYRADRRQQIRAVMRYAGPRMLWRHPWIALRHLLDARRSVSTSPQKKRSAAAAKR